MGINQTNRIINPRKQLSKYIEAYIAGHEYNKKHNPFLKVLDGVVDCTQCHRKMSKRLGKLQIENKRKNAPICIPCCEGRPRKPLSEVEDITAGFKESTKIFLKRLKAKK